LLSWSPTSSSTPSQSAAPRSLLWAFKSIAPVLLPRRRTVVL
jgi:hypothetical protein